MDAITSSNILIAQSFTAARKDYSKLTEYPGDIPLTLEGAYDIQDQAIELWPHDIGGWKVGGVGGVHAENFGIEKLAGPIFKNQIYNSKGQSIAMPVFDRGFAAIEAEIILLLKDDAPVGKMDWSLEEATEMVGSVHLGVEIASSPFEGINEHGPLVTISDFGNNYGLIIGEEIPNWTDLNYDEWQVQTIIDGQDMGQASSADMPGGPIGSLRFLLKNTAKRNLPLKAGMAISTGAMTGVHRAYVGQSSTVKGKSVADINLHLVSTEK